MFFQDAFIKKRRRKIFILARYLIISLSVKGGKSMFKTNIRKSWWIGEKKAGDVVVKEAWVRLIVG